MTFEEFFLFPTPSPFHAPAAFFVSVPYMTIQYFPENQCRRKKGRKLRTVGEENMQI